MINVVSKLIKGFLIFIISFSFLNAAPQNYNGNLVIDRTHFHLISLQDGSILKGEELKGHFSLLWFFDIYCPHSLSTAVEVKKVLAYIQEIYPSDLVKFYFVEAVKRSPQEIYYFINKFGFDGYNFYMSPSMNTNTYLNVDRVPTLIILDPNGNIVDKIENEAVAITYIRHLDYIVGKYCIYNGNCDLTIDPHDLVKSDENLIFNRFQQALKDYAQEQYNQ